MANKQKQVWYSVTATQSKLASGLNSNVASPTSATSLQLSLENETLQGARSSYLAALTIFKAISGHSPEDTTWRPSGVGAEEADYLRAAADGQPPAKNFRSAALN